MFAATRLMSSALITSKSLQIDYDTKNTLNNLSYKLIID